MSPDPSPTGEVAVLEFPDGIPGFPDAHRFTLLDLTDEGTFQLLQSVDHPDLSMVVATPWLFFPSYAPELEPTDRRALQLEDADDAVVFCAVTAEDDELFVNLLGPFVVNAQSRRGRQVVLADQDLPARAPVPMPED